MGISSKDNLKKIVKETKNPYSINMKTRPSSAVDCLDYLARKLQLNSDMKTDVQKLHSLLYLSLREGFAIVQEPLFDGFFVRLDDGPFCTQLEPMDIRSNPLFQAADNLNRTVKLVLNSVLEQYGFMDSEQILSVIQQDSAWIQADVQPHQESVIDPVLIEQDSRKINLLRSLWCINHNTYTETSYMSAALA